MMRAWRDGWPFSPGTADSRRASTRSRESTAAWTACKPQFSVKLRHLHSWTQARRRLASEYSERLQRIGGVQVPVIAADREHVFHLYMIKHERRDELAAYLAQSGVQTSINYPVALPFLPAYRRFGHRPEEFPNAFANQSRIVSLPMFAEMTAAQVQAVVQAIASFPG
ncbi:MAG: DegT/DnrJ/EryC1/StrS family aminotransferase [Nocardioides sp.]